MVLFIGYNTRLASDSTSTCPPRFSETKNSQTVKALFPGNHFAASLTECAREVTIHASSATQFQLYCTSVVVKKGYTVVVSSRSPRAPFCSQTSPYDADEREV